MESKSHKQRELLETAFYQLARAQFRLLQILLKAATRPKPFESTLRNYLKRPEWLYAGNVNMDPVGCYSFRERKKSNDVQLCGRLIASYQLSVPAGPTGVSGIWSSFVERHYRGLHSALRSQNSNVLSEILSGMFQESFLYGISSSASGLRAGKFIRMKLVEEILALAEALGAVRAETPEQGILGHALSAGIEDVLKKIEDHLGMAIDFPDVGGAYGIKIGDHLITPETPEHVYVAHRIKEAVSFHMPTTALRVLEIGAGFGGTAYWLMRMQPIAQYTIVDLPLMNVCQGYFLAKVFGETKVRFFGEPDSANGAKIHVLPAQAKNQANDFNLLLNQNSMPEIPEDAVKDYLSWARSRRPQLFYSYNQEAFSLGHDNVPQTLVPKIATEIGGFRRLSRNYSWLRRGYVEEIYSLLP